jgi:hypothetical protein
LQDLLRENKIPGTVRSLINADLKKGKLESFLIRVTDINFPIDSLQFRRARGILDEMLQEKAKSLIGQQYSKKNIAEFVGEILVPMFKKKGYFRVQFQEPVLEIQTRSASEFGINIILDVIEGEPYRWEKAVWRGEFPMTSEDLDRMLSMKPGDVADSFKIDEGFSAIRREFSRKGYLEANAKETPEFNDAAGTIRYSVQLLVGPQYRMGSLTFKGVTEKIAKKMRSNWKMPAGNIFDALYPTEFLEKDAKEIIHSNRLELIGRISAPDREKLIVNLAFEFQQLSRK